jgi:hypothetical protein
MKSEARPRGSEKSASVPNSTTADATPTLNAAIRALEAGPRLDDLVGRSVLAIPQAGRARGLSTTWDGTRQVVAHLTSSGCFVEIQAHLGGCTCKVTRVPAVGAASQQLAIVESGELPEAVAKAAVIACLQMQLQPN